MKIYRKIGTKLILVIGVTTLIILGIYAYLSISYHSEVMLDEVERHALQLSETVKSSTKYGMLLNQRDHINEIIKTIGSDHQIHAIKIYNKSGEIVYSTNHSEVGVLVDKSQKSCNVCHNENVTLEKISVAERKRIFKTNSDSSRVLGIINPIYNEKSCYTSDCHVHSKESKILGVLDVTFYLNEIDNKIVDNEIRGIIFSIISFIGIAFIVGIFVKRYVDKPVKELVKATEEIGQGNLDYKITELSKDELGKLANSFNKMTQGIKEVRMQLFQSEKMASLGQLAAGVAHEINNPLTGVLTYSSFLLKRTKDNPEMQEDLNVIVRETLRSREIVKGLLDFARQSTPKKSLISINEIIDRAATVVANQLKISGVVLERKFDENLPKLTADANQIQQVFINLFVNGIDASSKKNGKLIVETKLTSLPPKGIVVIKSAMCDKNHSLLDPDFKIEGHPSIKMKIKSGDSSGIIHLDPVYGKQRHSFGLEIDKSKPISLHCPECEISLIDKSGKCPKCGEPLYKFNVANAGHICGCAKFNDDYQKWEHIDLEGPQKFIEIKVADNGSGISSEHLSKIFEPFFSTKGQKGTGLGLSVIWGIIDNHNGTITVESELEKGTAFTIRIPISS
ncbi:MAG: ATP-binding protein [Melioribacteraceae bacterium]|nr:ATP-binding protein [Melioribacteraceae bacterium]